MDPGARALRGAATSRRPCGPPRSPLRHPVPSNKALSTRASFVPAPRCTSTPARLGSLRAQPAIASAKTSPSQWKDFPTSCLRRARRRPARRRPATPGARARRERPRRRCGAAQARARRRRAARRRSQMPAAALPMTTAGRAGTQTQARRRPSGSGTLAVEDRGVAAALEHGPSPVDGPRWRRCSETDSAAEHGLDVRSPLVANLTARGEQPQA